MNQLPSQLPEKYIWDFLKSSPLLKEFLSGLDHPSMLDLGCRHGNSLFHSHHEFGFETCKGIDLSSLEYMLSDFHFFNKYHNSLNNQLQEILSQEYNPQKVLFQYYQLVVREKMNMLPLNKWEEFQSKFSIQYEKTIEDYFDQAPEWDSFDLVILGKVLHYKTLLNPAWVVQEAMKLLKKGGILFIKSWVKKSENEKRRNVALEDVRGWIEGFDRIGFIREGELVYIFLRK